MSVGYGYVHCHCKQVFLGKARAITSERKNFVKSEIKLGLLIMVPCV
jgi:hypothetical protein